MIIIIHHYQDKWCLVYRTSAYSVYFSKEECKLTLVQFSGKGHLAVITYGVIISMVFLLVIIFLSCT